MDHYMNRTPLRPKTMEQYRKAFPLVRESAREHGYAIGLHGSQSYDLDLIAAPWAEVCSTAEELALAISLKIGWYLHPDIRLKPHGRKAFLIYGIHSAHIDLSVMPKGSP